MATTRKTTTSTKPKAPAKEATIISPTFAAAQTAEAEEGNEFEAMQAALSEAFDRPDDMPALRPIQATSRRERATILRSVNEMRTAGFDLEHLAEDDISTMADFMDLLGSFEEALIAVAVNDREMEAWCQESSNQDLSAAFMHFITKADLGKLIG